MTPPEHYGAKIFLSLKRLQLVIHLAESVAHPDHTQRMVLRPEEKAEVGLLFSLFSAAYKTVYHDMEADQSRAEVEALTALPPAPPSLEDAERAHALYYLDLHINGQPEQADWLQIQAAKEWLARQMKGIQHAPDTQ